MISKSICFSSCVEIYISVKKIESCMKKKFEFSCHKSVYGHIWMAQTDGQTDRPPDGRRYEWTM